MHQKMSVPIEMPDPKEEEKKTASILPGFFAVINTEEEKGGNKKHRYLREQIEKEPPLPIVILPGKKDRKTLDNRVKKEMGNFPETWNGFLAYFDGEPVHDGKVDGYIVELSSEFGKYDFKFNDKYYKVNDDKIDEIEGAKSTFYNVLNNMPDYQDNKTNEELIKAFGYKNNEKR